MVIAVALAVTQPQVFVPPPAPPIKSGTIICSVGDRLGAPSVMSGELSNWRMLPNGNEVADLDLRMPGHTENPLRLHVAMSPLEGSLFDYDPASGTSVTGTLSISYRTDGWIMLERRQVGGATVMYLGFCESNFSREPRSLSQ